eukprot:scaffold276938_cov32-Tisochrysis_lutea.AAC.4
MFTMCPWRDVVGCRSASPAPPAVAHGPACRPTVGVRPWGPVARCPCRLCQLVTTQAPPLSHRLSCAPFPQEVDPNAPAELHECEYVRAIFVLLNSQQSSPEI